MSEKWRKDKKHNIVGNFTLRISNKRTSYSAWMTQKKRHFCKRNQHLKWMKCRSVSLNISWKAHIAQVFFFPRLPISSFVVMSKRHSVCKAPISAKFAYPSSLSLLPAPCILDRWSDSYLSSTTLRGWIEFRNIYCEYFRLQALIKH